MSVKVPQKVYDAIEAIRQSGKTNMLNSYEVQRLCSKWGHHDAVLWIADNRRKYATAIFEGFKVKEQSDE